MSSVEEILAKILEPDNESIKAVRTNENSEVKFLHSQGSFTFSRNLLNYLDTFDREPSSYGKR